MGFGVIGAGRCYLHLQQYGSSCSGGTFFNLAFCRYLHLQFFNWASVPGGRFSNPPKTPSPNVGCNFTITLKATFILTTLILTTSFCSFGQKVTNEELLTNLEIKTFRVPSFPKKQWIIEIIPDTLQKSKIVNIDKVLLSKTTALIAIKFDNDTTISFTLIQNKNTSSQGTMLLKQSRYDITWNKFPERLFKNTFVIATIKYEQNENNAMQNLTGLLVVQLIDELKF